MIELEAWDADRQDVVRRKVELDDGSPVEMRFLSPERCLHAAVGVRLEGGRRLVLGVSMERWDEFNLTVEQIRDKFRFDAEGSDIYYLPHQGGNRVNRPIRTSNSFKRLDVVFLVDASMRLAPKRFLLDRTRQTAGLPKPADTEAPVSGDAARAAIFAPILEALGKAMAGASNVDLNACVCSFADLRTQGLVDASDLQPSYVTKPPSPRLQKVSAVASVQKWLDTVDYSTGADFVDAVAEGLQLCGTVRWRADSRRIVILIGDSPGFAFRAPIRGQMDLHARALDVHVEAERLAAKGIEIVTVFSGLGQAPNSAPKSLIEPIAATREQYRALASSDDYAFAVDWDSSQPSAVNSDYGDRLTALLGRDQPPRWLGRGLCWAIFAAASP